MNTIGTREEQKKENTNPGKREVHNGARALLDI
jgi:hypothetical protein